ncbi:MAG: hypothetical protein EP338_07490 [Bacteroidetes bacterium]|nr:MAG: hypothetical protein EP338_07490 [Bacteroidota bacterium]
MLRNALIGDSGGSGTTWCHVDREGRRRQFQGPSYHPAYWSDDFWGQSSEYWKQSGIEGGPEVYLYGAGLGNENHCASLKHHLEGIGFRVKEMSSDVQGIAQAALGKKRGYLAILGTGSVYQEYDQGKMLRQLGGYGHLFGDEGSAYGFGRILVRKYLDGLLPGSLYKWMEEKYPSRESLLAALSHSSMKYELGQLAVQSQNCQEKEFIEEIHLENLKAFQESCLKHHSEDLKTGYFVGSYAVAQSGKIKQLLEEVNLEVEEFVAEPIELIVDFLDWKSLNL